MIWLLPTFFASFLLLYSVYSRHMGGFSILKHARSFFWFCFVQGGLSTWNAIIGFTRLNLLMVVSSGKLFLTLKIPSLLNITLMISCTSFNNITNYCLILKNKGSVGIGWVREHFWSIIFTTQSLLALWIVLALWIGYSVNIHGVNMFRTLIILHYRLCEVCDRNSQSKI